jgi:hypothetical protein
MPSFLWVLRSCLSSCVAELSILLLSDILSPRQFFFFSFISSISCLIRIG